MRIAVIPGDGIGLDVTAEAVKVIRAVGEVFGRTFDLEMLPYGADYYLRTGISLPPNGHATLRDDFDAIFIGALGDPRIPDMRHARDILLGTRFALDLYVNVRPVRLLHERLCPLKGCGPSDIDFVVFRENTEGVYVNVGGRFKAGDILRAKIVHATSTGSLPEPRTCRRHCVGNCGGLACCDRIVRIPVTAICL